MGRVLSKRTKVLKLAMQIKKIIDEAELDIAIIALELSLQTMIRFHKDRRELCEDMILQYQMYLQEINLDEGKIEEEQELYIK